MTYGDAATKYAANNPHLSSMQGEMVELQKSIKDELERINKRARNDVVLSQRTVDGIQKSYDKQQGVVNKLNDGTVELEVLAGEALSSRQLCEELYTRLQDANIEAGVSATNLSLVDEARSTAEPQRPNWILYPAIALGLGLLLGIPFALAVDSWDDAIVTVDQIEKIGWVPVIGLIPLFRTEDRAPPSNVGGDSLGRGVGSLEQSPLLTRSNYQVAESYRALRTAILLSIVDEPLRVLLMTSPLGGDGKTTTCYNTAVCFAQQGKRVLLVDADMRKPRAHLLFHAQQAPGLSEVLTGIAEFGNVISSHEKLANLYLLPSGTLPPNPADLISSKRFDALLQEASKQFDMVIIDSPPILMVTDPVILSTKTDGTIVVVSSRKTTRQVLKRSAEILSRSGGRKLGIVLNAMDTSSMEYYYSYGYYGDDKSYGGEA
jgi:succinoglycan biosynthesis transport protein ExoP